MKTRLLPVINCSFFVCVSVVRPLPLVAADSTPPTTSDLTTATQTFHGFDLTRAPRTATPNKLVDLLEERPKGSRSYEFRSDVKCVYSGLDGAVYHVPAKNCFYIQSDLLGSSNHTNTYYGPFPGDPVKELKLEKNPADR